MKKVEFNMEKEGREALKIGLKKKYQKDGKGKRAYLFLWPIILLLQLWYNAQQFSFLHLLVISFAIYYIKFCGQRVYKTL